MNSETKQCQSCKKDFTVQSEDFQFYEKIQVPPPTFCFHCRLQRRMAWRNERALYKRACDLCGEKIIAMYPVEALFPVYCRQCWYSDKWDPLQYGKSYDFHKNFFVQFRELLNVVPRIALQVGDSVNCEYTNQIANCKNSYLISSTIGAEDSRYSYRINYSRNVHDCFMVIHSEQCYETLESRESSGLRYSNQVANTLDATFCHNVRNVEHCFMTSNKHAGKYYFRNQQLSPEDYKKAMSEIDLGSYKKLTQYKEEFKKLTLSSFQRFARSTSTLGSVVHIIKNAKNCYYCFYGVNLENCRFCLFVDDARDSQDVNNGGHNMELVYETCTTGVNTSNVKFSLDAWPEVNNIEYSDTCRNGASSLFGCSGVRGKQYCILNKQYSEEEYGSLTTKIREHMDAMPYTDAKGRVYKYGEFFPAELSLFGYNESMAQGYFSLTETEALEKGFHWKPNETKHVAIDIKAADLPDHIKDAPQDITEKVIGCAHEGKCNHHCTVGFKITAVDIQYYRKNNLALPRLCSNCRHYERFSMTTPINFWDRQCMCDYKVCANTVKHGHHSEGRCLNEFKTPYAPDRPEIVYCEQCYNAEVV